MKSFKLFILLTLVTTSGWTQDLTSTIKGTVVDKQSQFTMPGVNVILVGSDPLIGASTDMNGKFRLENVPIGRHTIQVSFLGYEMATVGNLLVNSGKELDLNIALVETIGELNEVVITGQADKRESLNKMATVSARQFSVEEAQRYSGALQDPARMAQNFAGVSGASDSRNDIIIRGNSPTGVLWRMEGIDIPSPNHFSSLGTTGGPVSMLNINNMSNSDFMTSAWTADYGNALSGVFDLKLRPGNSDKREYLGQVGFNGFELGAEGPFKKGGLGSYLVNYRYSTLGVFNAIGVDLGTGTAVPEYQDLTFKLNMPTQNAGSFTVWGIGGTSSIEFAPDGNDSTNLYSDGTSRTEFASSTAVVGASHQFYFSENAYYKLVLAASGSKTIGTGDSVGSETNDLYPLFGFDRQQVKYSANLKLNRKLNAKNTVSAGIIGDYYAFDILDSVRLDYGSFVTISDYRSGAALMQGYAQWQHRFNEKWTLNSGLHSQSFLLNNSHMVEPRLGLKYAINSRHTLNAGVGHHSQLQPITVYFIKETDVSGESYLPNKDLDFTKSIHTVLGHDFFVTENIRLKTEVYYQYLYNIPVDTFSSSFSMLNAGADFILPDRTGLANEGTGYNYGLEITLERFFNNGYYFLLTNSLFESKYKGSDGVERNTQFNGNYVSNVLAGKEFKLGKKSTLSFDTKVTYAGGRRYTPIDLEASRLSGQEELVESRAFSNQFDPYFRTDFKTTFRFNGRKISQQFSVDLQNITNQQNVFQQGYNQNTGEVGTVYQRGFFPDVQYKIYF
ncbi:MAG: TonB-dependent receptor [Flavobacteriales bacterium]